MDPKNGRPISRRGFGRQAALAAAVGALDPANIPAQGRGGGSPLPPGDAAEVDAKAADVVRKYGSRLTEEQKTRVRTVLSRHQRMLMRVREFPVENGDAPATALQLIPKERKN